MKLLTLVYLMAEDRVCLGYKKRDFGKGNWNGFGGKVEFGESLESAAERELHEEIGVHAALKDFTKVAIHTFQYEGRETHEVHTYLLSTWEGVPQESEEMKPKWFKKEALPYEEMWEDDRHWLPRVLKGEKLVGTVIFDTNNTIQKMEWVSVDVL